jgi:nucleotide-binding universal stress UspA family protein
MSEYRRVLVAIDPTPGRQLTAPFVRRLIDTCDAEITMLHVVESQPWVGRAAHTLRLMTELEILANRRFRGASLARRIEWGRPADCILNVLRTDRHDLLLMTGMGTVASEVIAEAPCPVLLEWPVARPVNHARVNPVCCAIEWDGNEARLLHEAVRASALCEAPLILIESAGMCQRVEELRDRYAPAATIHVETGPLETGHPAMAVSRALRLHGAGLLVAGGSRASVMAAQGECPVLYAGRARKTQAARHYEFAARRSA